MARGPTSFTVEGIEPRDLAWHQADDALRREFWRAVVVFGLKAKEAELAKGLDRYGRPLRPVKASTRKHRESAMGPADPDAPPLMPAYAVSRTRLNLTGRAYPDRAKFFWTDGWGRILAIHAAGSRKRGLPKRDVIGLSPKSLRDVEARAAAWWLERTRHNRVPALRPVNSSAPAFRPLPAVGRTDFRQFTYGIGTPGGAGQAAVSARLFRSGRSTGFFQRKPGQGLPAFGGPGTTPPKPPPNPPPPPATPPPRRPAPNRPAPPPPAPEPAPAPAAARPKRRTAGQWFADVFRWLRGA